MVRLTDRPDMTIAVDWEVKNPKKPTKNPEMIDRYSTVKHTQSRTTYNVKNNQESRCIDQTACICRFI